MKKLLFIFLLCLILILLITCSSVDSPAFTDGDLEEAETNLPKSNFFGLVDYDNKHADGTFDEADYQRSGKSYTYTAEDISGSELESIINSKISSGNTIILDGSKGKFSLNLTKIRKSYITIRGINNAILDFSATYGSITKEDIAQAVEGVRSQAASGKGHYLSTYDSELNKKLEQGRGLYITGSYNIIEDLIIENAADNGLLIGQNGNYNIVRNVEARFCGDAGIQISGTALKTPVDCSEDYEEGGPHHNMFFNCYSHNNFDPWNLGENADGFAVKGGAGDYNYFENCIAEYNADDGWDCYRIRGSTTWVNCQANYNGLCQATGENWAEYSNGNGFKVGGGAKSGTFNGQTVNSPEKHPHAQYLKGCSAKGNRGNSGVGFDRNNQYGAIYLEDCFATDNHASILADGRTSLRHQDYALGSYGAKCYVKNCFIGSINDVVESAYAGLIRVKASE